MSISAQTEPASQKAPVPTGGFVPARHGTWVQQTVTILRKDLRVELRDRTAVNSIVLFAVTALAVVGFSLASGELSPVLKAALLWIVLFFAAFSGLANVFLHEEETGTALALRLCATPAAVYTGKLLFNLALLGVISIVVVPLFLVMMNVHVYNPAAFVATTLASLMGLGASATIVGAIISRARGRGALYGALGFPLLLPLLFVAVNATRLSLTTGAAWPDIAQNLVGLCSFAVMVITGSALLFPFVWEEA